jgi:hypothetical protein
VETQLSREVSSVVGVDELFGAPFSPDLVLDDRYRLLSLSENSNGEHEWDAWDIRLCRNVVLEVMSTACLSGTMDTIQAVVSRSRRDLSDVYDAGTHQEGGVVYGFVVAAQNSRLRRNRSGRPSGS